MTEAIEGTTPLNMDQAVANINDLRSRIQSGERPTREELKVALNNLRNSRESAATAKPKSAKPAPIDLKALFAEVKAETPPEVPDA